MECYKVRGSKTKSMPVYFQGMLSCAQQMYSASGDSICTLDPAASAATESLCSYYTAWKKA
jgi:hypothetical protein